MQTLNDIFNAKCAKIYIVEVPKWIWEGGMKVEVNFEFITEMYDVINVDYYIN